MTDTGLRVDEKVPDEVKFGEPTVVYRHRLATRVWHWTNVVTLFIMLMSGLTIFNAHPRLYWGQYGANHDYAWLQIGSAENRGYLRVGSTTIDTTGVLGRWTSASGTTVNRAFPYWATIPSSYNLAVARHWHLFFAWIFAAGILLYAVWSLVGRHLTRDLLPTRKEIAPSHILHDIVQHARLRFPKGEAARHYNVLQKLSYCVVLLVLLPAVVLTGLTMSPAMNAAWPWLLDIFGGRQSARSIHFIAATLLVLFILVHVAMVVLAGPINEVRSMVTGRYRLPKE
ncbi:cytochrome b/b6 domain-containing protein [Aurantimonas sp. HBX-1]|uniref:cytochrome b/b6 domain-containing protein n=1 Tax=Aurantimonas sp. HBX-1 TaxID=2906072 RepID=UPI001F17EF5C|nr:cytochrome b/b6 domain-containing protein [Aurantimonas sp. HBX-1]UIJ73456.1 cytochrome b/b6 domain-containing protein [Aurantimonas sp. HBX-1]